MTSLWFPVRGCLPHLEDENVPFMFFPSLCYILTKIPLCSPNVLFFLEVEDATRELNIAMTVLLCHGLQW